MDIIINNKINTPIYDQIYLQIKNQIMIGALKGDEVLPSIRALAKDLRISFITTKRAYDELEKEGFIYTIPAKGCYVSPKNTQLIKEEYLKEMEIHIERVAALSKLCDVQQNEVIDLIKEIWGEI